LRYFRDSIDIAFLATATLLLIDNCLLMSTMDQQAPPWSRPVTTFPFRKNRSNFVTVAALFGSYPV
jgi:hypothetical protein